MVCESGNFEAFALHRMDHTLFWYEKTSVGHPGEDGEDVDIGGGDVKARRRADQGAFAFLNASGWTLPSLCSHEVVCDMPSLDAFAMHRMDHTLFWCDKTCVKNN